MKPIDPRAPGGLKTPAAVYLLQRRDRRRFKIGWALDPLQRVQRLPEFEAQELDLDASHAVWLPHPGRAYDVERALHRGLAGWKTTAGHGLDGHTEWFLPAAWRPAVRLIGQMPLSHEATLPPRLAPLHAQPEKALEPVDSALTEQALLIRSAQDVLWDMEDLLLRVGAVCRVSTASQGDRHCIRLHGFRGRTNPALALLRYAVLDIECYRWCSGSQAGAFVQLMSYDGDDLVLQFAPMRHIRRWAEGALVWQVLALLGRLGAERAP